MDNIQDILVIGGGINGCGIACDAAGRGLSVTLCEQGDLGSGTSSNSSKLIHGGLRYLEHYEFRLVREALKEREVMLKKAPHIVWPVRIILPHHKELRPAWLLRLGLFIYDHLGGRRTLPGTETIDLLDEPHLSILKDDMVKGFEFSDCWVDDARLVVLNAMQARDHGAVILPRTKCIKVSRGEDGLWKATLKSLAGDLITIRARCVVNAAGIKVDDILDDALPGDQDAHLRLVKGSHIVTRQLYEGDHLYMFQNADDRIIFAIPYEGNYTLIGTTDAPYDPAIDGEQDIKISEAERDYLISCANEYLKCSISTDDIAWDYAGVRPLYDSKEGNASAVTRDYVFDLVGSETEAPILSIFGGKITTYRELAEHALRKLSDYFPAMGRDWTADAPLPGGDIEGGDFSAFETRMQARYSFMDKDILKRMLQCYGTLIDRLMAGASCLEDMGQHFGAGLYQREVDYLIANEWARSAGDIMWRRTKRGLHMSEDQKDSFRAWFAQRQA